MEAQELEKAQRELMEERVKMYAHRIEEMREAHREEISRLECMHKREMEHQRTRIQELDAQNDALLGAVGKLHVFQAKADTLERELQCHRMQAEIVVQKAEQEVMRLKDELKRAKAGKTEGA